MNYLRIFASLLIVTVFTAFPALAEKRLALVIGINAYQEVPILEKAAGDAKAIGAALGRVGFTVTTVVDANRRDLNRRLSDFENSISPGDLVLLQFSGHGVEIDGQNYLLPADVPKPRSNDRNYLKDEAISLNSILDRLNATGAAIRILIIDACRDNPFAQAGTKGIGGERGLARVEATAGTFIMFSAGYGETALDRLSAGDNDQTSVFTRVLLKHLTAPGEEITDVVKDVRVEVETLAKTVGHQQRPAYYDELSGRLVLNAAGGDTTTAPLTSGNITEGASKPDQALPADPVAADYQLTERIGTAEAWDAFLARHGTAARNFYVDLAKAARQKLALNIPKPPKVEPDSVSTNDASLSPFDGMWTLTRRATNSSCGWKELSANILVESGKIKSGEWAGTVKPDGTISVTHKFVHQGKNERNILNGKIRGDTGSGRFRHVGGSCAGTISLSRF